MTDIVFLEDDILNGVSVTYGTKANTDPVTAQKKIDKGAAVLATQWTPNAHVNPNGLPHFTSTNKPDAASYTGSQIWISDLKTTATSDGSRWLGIGALTNKFPTLKWDAALSNLRNGTGNAKVVFCGDSTGTGAHGNGVTWVGNLYNGAFRRQKALMSTPSSNNNVFGDSHVGTVGSSDPTTFLTYETRLTFGLNWLLRPLDTLGGQFFANITSTLSTLTFTPNTAFDTIDIYYYFGVSAGYGTFTVDIGAGVLATVNCTQAVNGIYKVSVPCTLGVNIVNINKTTAGFIAIMGISCYKNNSEIQMINASVNGQSLNQYFASTGYFDVRNALSALQPDLIIPALGINDSTGLLDLTQFRTNYQSYITYLKTIADVALCVENVTSNSNIQYYYDIIRDLASINNLNVIDFDSRMGSNWATSNSLGLMFDARHPVNSGYGLMADELYKSGIIAR